MDFIKRQQAHSQSFQFRHRLLRRIVNPNVDHLRIVFLDTAQPGVYPCLVDPVLIAAKSRQRDGQVGVTAIASGFVRAIKDKRIGMQARIEKRRMHHVLRICQTVRQSHFSKRLMLTEVQFPDATKIRSIFKPELVQPVIEIGDRQCLLATGLDILRRKDRCGRRTSDLRRVPVMWVCQTSESSAAALTSVKFALSDFSGVTSTRTVRSSPLANDIAW